MRSWIRAMALSVLGACGAGAVAGVDFPEALEEEEHWKGNEFIEPAPWQEEAVTPPAFPRDGDLLEVAVDDGGAGYTYFLDTRSLSTGTDGVVRYTAVIVSRAGARNVLFEGIRCATGEYKTYAYGTADATLQPMAGARWDEIAGGGAMHLRRDLREYYLCDPTRRPLQPTQVMQRIKYPPRDSYPF